MTGKDEPQINFRGLITNPNELAVAGDGAFRKFVNGVLTRPALAQARRGVVYAGTANAQINKFFNYDGSLLFHRGVTGGQAFSTVTAGTVTNISGNVTALGSRVRGCIAGKNFYVAGTVPWRLSGTSSTPTAAGGLYAPGFDRSRTKLTAGSMLETAKAVAYRYCFGFTDAKENLHLGEVSGRLLVSNTTGATCDPTIRAIVPSTATTSHFIQFYRSAKVAIDATTGQYLADDDLQLVFEQQLKAADITNGYVELADVCPEGFRGALIYTAPLARDATAVSLGVTGAESANRAPPSCGELCEHNNRTWFANTTQPGEFFLQIISAGGAAGIQSGDVLRFAGLTNAFNLTAVRDFYVTLTKTASTTVTAVTDTAHGYSTNDYVMIAKGSSAFALGPFQITVTSVTEFNYVDPILSTTASITTAVNLSTVSGPTNGTYVLSADSAWGSASARIEATAQNIVAAFNKHTTNTELWAQYVSGEEDVPGLLLFRGRTPATTTFVVYAGAGSKRDCFSPQLLPLNHTVNLSRTSNVVTATVASGAQSFKAGEQVLISPAGAGVGGSFGAGPFTITSVTSTTFLYAETAANATLATQDASITPLDAGDSEVESKPNRVYYSKSGEFEATTRNGFVDVGSSLGTIKVMLSQRGQIWVWKTDGIYRIIGGADTSVVPQDIRVEALDSSIVLRATESVVLFANRCWGLTDRGVVAVSESGLEVMSKAITDDLTRAWSTINNLAAGVSANGVVDMEADAFATAYESEHSYILHIPTIYSLDGNPARNGAGKYGGCPMAYVYNTESQAWGLWDWGVSGYGACFAKRCAIVNVNDDKLYLGDGYTGVAGDGYLFAERKILAEGVSGDYRDTTPHAQVYSLARTGGNLVTATVSVGTVLLTVGDSVRVAVGSGNFAVGPHVVTAVGSTTFTYTESGSNVTLASQTVFREKGIAITWAWVLQTLKAPAMEKRWDELKFLFAQRETYFPTDRANSQKAFSLALANETSSVAAFAVASSGTQIARIWPDADVARGHRLLVTLTHSTIDEAFDLAGIDFKAEVLGGASTR